MSVSTRLKQCRDRPRRLHPSGFGLEDNQPAQAILVPGGHQPLVGNAHLGTSPAAADCGRCTSGWSWCGQRGQCGCGCRPCHRRIRDPMVGIFDASNACAPPAAGTWPWGQAGEAEQSQPRLGRLVHEPGSVAVHRALIQWPKRNGRSHQGISVRIRHRPRAGSCAGHRDGRRASWGLGQVAMHGLKFDVAQRVARHGGSSVKRNRIAMTIRKLHGY